jgi:hypothetical protein
MADNYRVEVCYWYRDLLGDWDVSDYWLNFATLDEAIDHANSPRGSIDNIIDAKVYTYEDNCATVLFERYYRRERANETNVD